MSGPALSRTGPAIPVVHLPPGTGRSNRIKRRVSCSDMQGWQGQPLVGCQATVTLVAATTAGVDLTIRSHVHDNS